MKQIKYILVFLIFAMACSNDNDDQLTSQPNLININFTFTHHWDGTDITNENFNTIQFTNANGDMLSIEKLRYLISNITFQSSNGSSAIVHGYNLVDVTNNSNLTYSLSIDPDNFTLPLGTFENISFTFGFNNDDNYGHSYPDLNTAIWNVPDMMGGGYHYMQLEGKFINSNFEEMGYAYHAIRAVDMNNAPDLTFEDTFFEVNLGEISINNSDTEIEIKMNIAEWFKNPNTWDLNILNNTLMPNFNAQIMMYENGQSVFDLGNITNE